jgi:hypothetical protein
MMIDGLEGWPLRTIERGLAMQQICGTRGCDAPLTKGAISRDLRLCTTCRNLLADRLIELPRLYRACEQVLEVRRQHSVGAPRGRRSTGICLDELTVAARGDTIRVLASFCEMVIDERGVTGPSTLDVKALTSFLRAHLDWLVAHDIAADFAEEIVAAIADLRQVLDPVQVRTIDLGPCTRDGCGRMVRARVSVVNQRSAPQVGCDGGHTWQPRQWLGLRHQLGPVGQAAARSLPA